MTLDGEVDHKVPLSKATSEADKLRLGQDGNLQYLCRTPCHEHKTIRESGGKPVQAIGEDGWPR